MKWPACIITLALLVAVLLQPLHPLFADWFFVVSGDVHSNTTLDSNIPGNSEYFSVHDGTSGLRVGDSGVITHDDGSADVGRGSETPDISGGSGMDWVFQSGAYPRTGNQYGYTYYSNLLTSKVPLPNDMLNGSCDNVQPPGIYYQNGPFTITCPYAAVPLQQGKYVFLFSGDVTIRSKIRLQQPDDFVAVISAGSIIIGDQVNPTNMSNPAVQGVFIADNQIRTTADSQDLYLEGIFIAWDSANTGQSFSLLRDSGNPPDAKEVFIHRPGLLFSFPDELLRDNTVWEEVSP